LSYHAFIEPAQAEAAHYDFNAAAPFAKQVADAINTSFDDPKVTYNRRIGPDLDYFRSGRESGGRYTQTVISVTSRALALEVRL
jgi:hypothetical protein